MFQATAPVSIPVGPELAGLGSGNGSGPGTGPGPGNAISVSWQSPHVIFKGAPVSAPFLKASEQPSCRSFTRSNVSFGRFVSSLPLFPHPEASFLCVEHISHKKASQHGKHKTVCVFIRHCKMCYCSSRYMKHVY